MGKVNVNTDYNQFLDTKVKIGPIFYKWNSSFVKKEDVLVLLLKSCIVSL